MAPGSFPLIDGRINASRLNLSPPSSYREVNGSPSQPDDFVNPPYASNPPPVNVGVVSLPEDNALTPPVYGTHKEDELLPNPSYGNDLDPAIEVLLNPPDPTPAYPDNAHRPPSIDHGHIRSSSEQIPSPRSFENSFGKSLARYFFCYVLTYRPQMLQTINVRYPNLSYLTWTVLTDLRRKPMKHIQIDLP
jgi:hypothetical protein